MLRNRCQPQHAPNTLCKHNQKPTHQPLCYTSSTSSSKPQRSLHAQGTAVLHVLLYRDSHAIPQASETLDLRTAQTRTSFLKAGQGRVEHPHPPTHFAGSRWAGKEKCPHRALLAGGTQTRLHPTSLAGRATCLQCNSKHVTCSMLFRHLHKYRHNTFTHQACRHTFFNGPHTSTTPGLLQLQPTMGGGVTDHTHPSSGDMGPQLALTGEQSWGGRAGFQLR